MSLATRLVLWLLCAVFSALMGIQSSSRYASYHNHTYDLALYARQAWGLAHGDFWDPIVNAPFLGTHVAIVLWPLGLLGRVYGTVPVLLTAQALAFGLATLPLAAIARRRFGDAGALCAAVAWLLYPNLSQVASYEFHPGSLAVLPLAIALDALDRQRWFGFALSCLALLACRADLAMLTALLGVLAIWPGSGQRALRAAGGGVLGISLAYLGLQFGYLRPHYWSQHTSFDLHFGIWGGSPLGVVRALFHDPARVRDHFFAARRIAYLPKVLWPLGFLPLLAPRLLLLTLPFFACNLISAFPTSVEMYSHYLTLAIPPLVAGALLGVERATRFLSSHDEARRLEALLLSGLIGLSIAGNICYGGLPWSRTFERDAFAGDAYSAQAARIAAAIPAGASLQAPDPLLPHLAERSRLYRAPPPDRDADYVVLDIGQRERYAQREVLLRTLEEPIARNWLARRDYGLVAAEPRLLLFGRGRDPRAGIAARYFTHASSEQPGVALTRCLSVLSAWLDPQGLELELAAHAPCPADLALRIGSDPKPARVDLMFDGLLSPAQLRDEQVISWHALDRSERAQIIARGLRVGALRSSGTPPEPGDPVSVAIPLIH